MKTKKIIAANLKFLRIRERKGRGRLAKILKISMQKIDRMERGVSIDVNTLVVYSQFFNIPIDRIVREDLTEGNKTIIEADWKKSKDYYAYKSRENKPIFNKSNLNQNNKRTERSLNKGKLITWRNKVNKRDNYICVKCGKKSDYIHTHHILSFTDYPSERYKIENGITLCEDCHIKFHKEYGFKKFPPISEIESISKTEKIVIPLSENEKKALSCAKRAGFNCYYFNERKEQFDYCKDCFKASFWNKKDIAQELYNTKTEDIKIEGEEYLSCEHFQMNPFPNCYFRNIQKVSSPKCQKCVRDIARWGEQAIGYRKL